MEETHLIQFKCANCGHVESFFGRKTSDELVYKVLGDGIIMLCSASAVGLTILQAILGFAFGGNGQVSGLRLFFLASILLVLSFGCGLFAYFTLVTTIHERGDIYSKTLSVPVALQQYTLLIALVLLVVFFFGIITK